MAPISHWTQNSITDFVYSISSNFVAQIETKIEAEDISQNEIANNMRKTNGRVSQLLNNPGNLSIRVMAELARAAGMKISIVAYDDNDPDNERGPIDPDVFVKCWQNAGRPSDHFEVEDAFTSRTWKDYFVDIVQTKLGFKESVPVPEYGVNVNACEAYFDTYSNVNTLGLLNVYRTFELDVPQVSKPSKSWQRPRQQPNDSYPVWQQQTSISVAQEILA